MKKITKLLLSGIAFLGLSSTLFAQRKIEVNWQQTFYANVLADGISTYQFRKKGHREENPIMAPFVNKDRWVEAGLVTLGYIYLVDHLPKKDRKIAYIALSLLHAAATLHNKKELGTTMIPLLVIKF